MTPSHLDAVDETLYCPVPANEATGISPARRLGHLKGLTVGFLGNLKSNCDTLLHATEAVLMKRGAAGTFYREKTSASLGADAALLDEIAANCQVAVVGLGN